MPIKSTQTNKYETACFIQEAAIQSDMKRDSLKILKTIDGRPYCRFESVLWSFAGKNRMNRFYDLDNAKAVINTDERIQHLKALNKWRGELNHPNPEIEGQKYSNIRMTIPEQTRTSHFINHDKFEGLQYRAEITTNSANTECGNQVNSEIIDQHAVPSFSVRLMGTMVPNAAPGRPNMRVNKVITFDMVDFPSHDDAVADVTRPVVEYASCTFLKDLAKYCAEQDESLAVVCESFEISPEELFGITTESVEIHQDGNKILIPTPMKIRDEVASILKGRSF